MNIEWEVVSKTEEESLWEESEFLEGSVVEIKVKIEVVNRTMGLRSAFSRSRR